MSKLELWTNFHKSFHYNLKPIIDYAYAFHDLNTTFCSRFVSYNNMMKKWCIPFLGADPSVVRRSQRHSVDSRDKRPLQYGAYVAMPSLLTILLFLFFGFFFALLCQFNKGRKLLEKVTLTGCPVQL